MTPISTKPTIDSHFKKLSTKKIMT